MFLLGIICLGLNLCVAAPSNSGAPQNSAATLPSPPAFSADEISHLQNQAQAGDAVAQFKLGKAYELGDRLAADDAAAAAWLRKSAEQGNADAQNELGVLYLSGRGVSRDEGEALVWYHKAARQGNSAAMFNLGAAYYNGNGVGIDDEMSYAWFMLSKEAGNPNAAKAVAQADSELKPWRIAESFKELGSLYDTGADLPENRAEAIRWWTKAAKRDDRDAQVLLASRFLNGPGTRDFEQGRYWCDQLAKKNDVRGYRCMGEIYQRGVGLPADPKLAKKWYERGELENDPTSIRSLAEMEATGDSADRQAACLEYIKLIRDGDKDAARTLARMRGEMGPADWKKVQRKMSERRINPKTVDAILDKVATP